ncbi:protein toll [Acyrthosiphon pisum]|uniref:TIR domain-containing protein n=1 Tax=Acyrthosiphon pisum TaxID=7029 RepID=A0A8R2B548_ACYPI|nr:protein toll [Acyrthosiphon pisum]|eukprot:XP_008182102.1 PREDICTED: protein toll [Acyrthosiphon pisum]
MPTKSSLKHYECRIARHILLKMNWLMHIIILQVLLGQVLSNLTCTNIKNIDKCSCKHDLYGEDIEVECGLSTLELNLMESIIKIECNSDQTKWEQNFGQIDINKLHYAKCLLSDSGINQTISTLGINKIQSLKLVSMRLNGSLENTYLSNLESVETLDITLTKLILTNESFEGTPRLTKLYLRENYIEDIPAGVFKPLTLLQILDLGDNKITKINSDLFYGIPLKRLNLDTNYLTSLDLNSQSLNNLDVANNRITSLTVGRLNQLLNISLNKNILVTMPDQTFKNTSLVSIRFSYGNFTTIPQRFLTNLDRLLNVYLTSLNIEKVPENMIWDSQNITNLSLASNRLKELPVMFFRDARKLKLLDLSKNQIENINHELLGPLINLETLDLSNNLIIKINNYSLKHLRNLKYLNLERNKITNINREALNVPKLKTLKLAYNKISNLTPNNVFSLYYLDQVETIDLSNNFINCIDPGWVNLIKLININLSSNNFTVLRIQDIQYINEIVKTNLNNNPLEVIDLSNLEIFAKAQSPPYNFWNNRQINLSSDKFICDCRNYEYARFLHNQMPKIVYKYLQIEQKLICNDGLGTEFSNLNIESLTCDWKIFEDVDKTDCFECECTYRPHDKSALMNCSNRNLIVAPEVIISSRNVNYTELNLRNNSITKLPNYENLNIKKLNIGYNNLNTINITQLPKYLTELHLEHNNLTMISETNLTNILPNLNNLTMNSNSWICDCNAKNTINFIHKYSSKIFDLANITCDQSSTLLQTLTEKEVCQEELNTDMITVSMFLAVLSSVFSLGLLWMLYSNNKTKIKIWLYSYNITWPISEESLDLDKKYDAFISYSHMDIELVEKHLVPGLEGGSSPFKLCLHYRDWVVGEWIPNQIARSVDESRRTIIVLSQNYLKSVWGRTEFRTAYSSALNERRSRLIVILYNDISEKDLDSELEAYLSMNTYIKWGDRWFWEKLRYALPHRPATKKNTRAKIIVPDKLNSVRLT